MMSVSVDDGEVFPRITWKCSAKGSHKVATATVIQLGIARPIANHTPAYPRARTKARISTHPSCRLRAAQSSSSAICVSDQG